MNLRLTLPLLLLATGVVVTDTARGVDNPATNKDGSIVTDLLTAVFDPNAGLEGVPIPNNLFYLGTTDLTLNAPTEGLDGTAAALVNQINSLDGFSTTERWTTTFVDGSDNPAAIDPASVVPGDSVRVFQVTTQGFVAVTGVIRELTPGVDYVAAASGNVVAILPLKPLAEYSSYMAVLTNDINDARGNDASSDTTYHLSKADEPWVDENGKSTYPLLPDDLAQAVEPLRQITATMEAAAASQGINPDDIVLSWTVQTQSITPVLGLLRSTVQPGPVTMGPKLGTTADLGLGLPGLADFYMGVITMPYYSGLNREDNPTAILNEFWTAEPGAYIPPFDQFGLDPTSTNITVANPFPVVTGMQTVPVMVTVPNASTGMVKPEGGWPVVIFGHGVTRNRTDVFAVADGLAAAGFVAVAIDFPLHGLPPENPLYIGNTPFGAVANERTFDVDYVNNETGEQGPDGIPDPSGAYALNFSEYRTSRDNLRQGVIDLSVLASSLGNFDLDADGTGDLRPFNAGYLGQSWGGIHGTVFTALEPLVDRAVLNVPAGGLVRAGEASPTFGPRIRAGLESVGIFPGDPLFELYLTVGQSVADAGDPINWVSLAAMNKPVLLQEVIGDTVLPNVVPGAFLSGTEPLIRIGGLEGFSTSQADPDGLRVASRFVPPANHGSLLSPAGSPAATFEMQGQAATFLASSGTFVQVGDESTLVPVMSMSVGEIRESRVETTVPYKKPSVSEPTRGPWQPLKRID